MLTEIFAAAVLLLADSMQAGGSPKALAPCDKSDDPEEAFRRLNWILPIEHPTNPKAEWDRRKSELTGKTKLLTGFRFNCEKGRTVRATADGRVLFVGWYGGYGKVVILEHGKGLASLYAHMCRTGVIKDQVVTQGQPIGTAGTTGFATLPGLNFQIRKDGKPVSWREFTAQED